MKPIILWHSSAKIFQFLAPRSDFQRNSYLQNVLKLSIKCFSLSCSGLETLTLKTSSENRIVAFSWTFWNLRVTLPHYNSNVVIRLDYYWAGFHLWNLLITCCPYLEKLKSGVSFRFMMFYDIGNENLGSICVCMYVFITNY